MSALKALEENDARMNQIGMGDLEGLEEAIARRSVLLEAAMEEIERLRQAGDATPDVSSPGAPGRIHREALERSSRAGMQAIRQIILARHMLTGELSRLKQEQQLLGGLSESAGQSGRRLELCA